MESQTNSVWKGPQKVIQFNILGVAGSVWSKRLLRALAREVLDCINSWEPVSHFDYPYGESIFLMCFLNVSFCFFLLSLILLPCTPGKPGCCCLEGGGGN